MFVSPCPPLFSPPPPVFPVMPCSFTSSAVACVPCSDFSPLPSLLFSLSRACISCSILFYLTMLLLCSLAFSRASCSATVSNVLLCFYFSRVSCSAPCVSCPTMFCPTCLLLRPHVSAVLPCSVLSCLLPCHCVMTFSVLCYRVSCPATVS